MRRARGGHTPRSACRDRPRAPPRPCLHPHRFDTPSCWVGPFGRIGGPWVAGVRPVVS
ncbi:hypothetical protein P355_4257 [Burkholderia cenocepacia KC-01]|nr:hypothetical protein P355_4257 [Burkholderia cenocepacia KC-01]